MKKLLKLAKLVDTLRLRYHRAITGKEALVVLLREAEVADHVYNSNAIENSTLTLEETEKILLELELSRYVSERELFEAKNLARVMEYVEKQAPARELDTTLLLSLHEMLLGNISKDIAGRFRQPNEYVRVGTHIAPDPKTLLPTMHDILATYRGDTASHIIARIARLHLAFEHLHPFVDGNGRIGRVMNNYLLIRDGYVPINIKFMERTQYYEAFKEYDRAGMTRVMEDIVGRALCNSYHRHLAYLEGKQIVTLASYAKSKRLSHPNLINKAKRQTIEAFLEKGTWKIGM